MYTSTGGGTVKFELIVLCLDVPAQMLLCTPAVAKDMHIEVNETNIPFNKKQYLNS